MKPTSTRLTAKNCVSGCLLALSFVPVYAAGEAAPKGQSALSDLHCVVMPSAVVDVASGVSGRVEAIHVERGDSVTAGQVVAALDSGVEQANLVLARARAELDTDIHLREARLAFEKRKLERTDRLQANRVVSVHEKDEVKTDAKLAQWQLRKAVDDRYLASLELVRAAEVLKRRSVQSPIDGVVVDRFKWPGEYVEEEPILRVARLDPLWVEVVAPVARYGDISKNMLAEIMTETEGGEMREARVTVVDPMGDAASGTFRVRLEVPNPDLSLLGGIKCKARFPQPARFAPEVEEATPAVEKTQVTEPAPVPNSSTPRRSASVAVPAVAEPYVYRRAVREDADGYIVVSPLVASADERRGLEADLRAAGINDFALLRSGPYAGRVSLGIYNGPRMAERRRSQLAARGFDTDVVPRTPTESRVQAYAGAPAAQAQAQTESKTRARQGTELHTGECATLVRVRVSDCVGSRTATPPETAG